MSVETGFLKNNFSCFFQAFKIIFPNIYLISLIMLRSWLIYWGGGIVTNSNCYFLIFFVLKAWILKLWLFHFYITASLILWTTKHFWVFSHISINHLFFCLLFILYFFFNCLHQDIYSSLKFLLVTAHQQMVESYTAVSSNCMFNLCPFTITILMRQTQQNNVSFFTKVLWFLNWVQDHFI